MSFYGMKKAIKNIFREQKNGKGLTVFPPRLCGKTENILCALCVFVGRINFL